MSVTCQLIEGVSSGYTRRSGLDWDQRDGGAEELATHRQARHPVKGKPGREVLSQGPVAVTRYKPQALEAIQ